PYTFLDEAPLEERRARAVQVRRSLPAEDAAGLGALDAGAIQQVVSDARPVVRDAEELHDWMLSSILVPAEGVDAELASSLTASRRAARLSVDGRQFWVCAERLPVVRALFPEAQLAPALELLEGDRPVTREEAVLAVVRGRMEVAGPLTVS